MSYTGTKLGQDIRFKDPNKDILSSMKTPKIYKTTVSKQNIIILPIIKLWLTKKIIELLEFEDETLVNLILNLIKSSSDKIDPKNIQYQISGFLGEKTYSFMKQFWKLLISVQESFLNNNAKIPEELIPYKEELELEQEKKKNNYSNSNYKRNYYNKDYYDDNNSLYNNDIKEKSKKELKEALEYYNNDKYKKKNRGKSRIINKSKSKDKNYKKKEYYRSRSRSREKDYKYNSRSKDRKKYKRNKSRNISYSSESNYSDKKIKKRKEHEYEYEYYNRKNNGKKRKNSDYSDYSHISNDYSNNYDYDHYKKKKHHIKEKNDSDNSISSDSSETFKI